MLDNYAEETQPLFKLLRTPAFRFVVVRFNHYSLVRRLQSDLLAQFPDRKVSTINTEKATYEEILKTYLEQEEGFFFLENFEDILKRDADSLGKVTPEMAKNNKRRSSIAAGLNMRRDKLAKSPIAIVAFVFASAGEHYARSLMEKMPDLWSFRSLLLDMKLEQEKQEVLLNKFPKMHPKLERTTDVSSLGGLSKEEKLSELDRLLVQVNETPASEINYSRNLYGQIAILQKETGQYNEAIKTIGYLIENETDNENRFRLLIDKGDLFKATGNIDNSLVFFNKAKELADILEDNYLIWIALQRFGKVNMDLGNLYNALIQYEKALSIIQKLHEANPNDKMYKNGLAISYSNLGNAYLSLGHLNEAITSYEKDFQIAKELLADFPRNISFKTRLAISYENLGNFHFLVDNLDSALSNYRFFNLLMNELYEAYPQNAEIKNGLAISHTKIGQIYSEKLNKFQSAVEHYKNAKFLWSELLINSPQDVEFKNNLKQVQKELASLSN
jgi:tetratricopeptide (TPR) repeat protein